MIRRAITAARTVLAIARDAALDLRDERRGSVAVTLARRAVAAEDRARASEHDRGVWRRALDEEQRLHAVTKAEVTRLTELVSDMVERRERLLRSAFSSGYAAACTGGMSASDHRRLRERVQEYVQAVLRG